MKRRRRILPIILAIIMLLSLLPTAVSADPPRGDTHLHSWYVKAETPATCTERGTKTWKCTLCGEQYSEVYKPLGHDWDGGRITKVGCEEPGVKTYTCKRCGATYTEPTPASGHDWDEGRITKIGCEEPGVKTYTCKRCGAAYTEPTPASGHNWDEGVITREPSYFTPGIRTYTCKNDASHTYTEEIDPTEALFAIMYGTVYDPEFGSSQAVTYDLKPLIITEQPVGGSLTRYEDESYTMHVTASGGQGDYKYEWHSSGQELWKRDDYNTFLKWLGGLFGVSADEVDAMLEESYSDTDTCTVTQAGQDYYCVVTDSEGNTATSDYAHVGYRVRIDKQPGNENLQPAGKAMLSCEAADGSGEYSYRWIDDLENEIGVGPSIEVDEIGDYMCIVTDDVTGESVRSYPCEVYSTDPFMIANITKDCEVMPDADTFVVASFAGGVEDYEIWWKKDGTAISSVEGRDELDHVYSLVYLDGAGVYTVYGVDSMLATASASVTITIPKLKIEKQPVGGTIPNDSYASISVSVSDGEAPYSYTLYRNGEEYRKETYDSASNSYRIWYSGNYYYHIEDSRGLSIDSDTVTFEETDFHIKNQTLAGEIWDADTPIYPGVTVEGGTEPYTYTWLYLHGATWYKVGKNESMLKVTTPGNYKCRITDYDGSILESKIIPITYTASKPRIVQQPVGGIIEEGESLRLSCSAVSAHEVRYDWYSVTTGTRRVRSLFKEDTQQIEVTKPRIYLCRVTDLVTGEYVESERVAVANPLKLENIYADGYAVKTEPNLTINDLGSYTFHLCITGGSPEYKVVVYAKDFGIVDRVLQPNSGTDVKCTVVYIKNTKEAKDCPIVLPKTYQAISPYYNDNQLTYAYYHYYFVITDALGQEVESKVFD